MKIQQALHVRLQVVFNLLCPCHNVIIQYIAYEIWVGKLCFCESWVNSLLSGFKRARLPCQESIDTM